jgi:molecular chaperone DnaK
VSSPCFGIDLGTTASAIGRVIDGRPQLAVIDGSPLVPSVLLYPAEGPPLVGQAAVNQEALSPERVVRSAKRKMGSEHTWTIDGRRLTPVDVAADLLRALADGAERAWGIRPERVVITVPAWFSQVQRVDTLRAGAQAGLEVVRLINEPTAAALAHAHGRPRTRRVLVYDFGGGTFDASLVDQDGPLLEVRASHGDVNLGGDDVDTALVEHVMSRLKQEDPDLAAAISEDPRARVQLAQAVEAAKIALSEQASTRLTLPFLVEVDGVPRSVDLTLEREDLEDIVLPLLHRTTACIDEVLSAAKCTPDAIDELLLVGGSSTLPLIWRGLRMRYGIEADASLPPRLAVALGAAIQAAIVDGSRVDGVLVDVAPYALSIGMAAGGAPGYPSHFVCDVITPRNAPLPSRHTALVRTGHPEQTRVRLPIYQGSHPDPRRNTILGEIVMEGLPPAPYDRLFRPIAIEVRHDLDGTVDVTVTDQLSGAVGTGRVMRDGVEQAALREVWEAHARQHKLEFGDPYEPPPRERNEAAPTNDPEVAAARELFQGIISRESTLQTEYPAIVGRLIEVARAGALAATMGRRDDCLAHAATLGDLLFEEGIYL